mmetsp:Transcript_105630/g.207167  ORF Transcript_105630/g.207167 Transcript_105630/m.207167 type:complete len:215 (-) Transcript_105630:194-838(-)
MGGRPTFNILKNLAYFGCSATATFSPSLDEAAGVSCNGISSEGSRSSMSGSTPSACAFCFTAGNGNPTFNILKNFTYLGCSETGTFSTSAAAGGASLRGIFSSAGLSSMLGSTPSACIFCFTAAAGSPIFNILKNLTYLGCSPTATSSPEAAALPLAPSPAGSACVASAAAAAGLSSRINCSGDPSSTSASSPSCLIFCITASRGRPTFNILKY